MTDRHDSMNPQSTDADVPIPWDPVECRTYIVTVIGNQERFPERYSYHDGSIKLQNRLHHRYGEDYAKSCSKLLRAFLEDLETGTPEERSIWHEWRLAHDAKVVRLPLSSHWLDILKASCYRIQDGLALCKTGSESVHGATEVSHPQQRITRRYLALGMTTTETIFYFFNYTELKNPPGSENEWSDPNKPDLRTKIKGVITNSKLRCLDFVGRSTPLRQKSPECAGFCSELNVTGLPC